VGESAHVPAGGRDPRPPLTGADHPRWVATRWSEWLRSHPPESWHGPLPDGGPGSLFATRAVLRVLQRLKLAENGGVRLEHLGLHPVADYDGPVGLLVRAHLGGEAHCAEDAEDAEATAAALELARWLGVVALKERRQIESWLRARFDALGSSEEGFAQRLEIARALEDPQLLRRSLGGRMPEALAIPAAITLRAAAVACGVQPPDVGSHVARAEVAWDPALGSAVAGGYLTEVARLRAAWAGKRSALMTPPQENVEQAVDTVVGSGRFLAADLATAAPEHEAVCAETLALLTHFPRDRRGMEAVAEVRRVLPATLTASAREEAGAAIARLAQEKARAEALAARARRVLLVPSLVAAAALAAAVALLVRLVTGADWTAFASLIVGLPVGLVAVTLALDGVGLASPWALRLLSRLRLRT
jgi:hypothetical protein